MGGLRTNPASLLALALLAPLPAAATEPTEILHIFADCAGRYAAVTEHLWLFDGPASELTAARRDAFRDLAVAVVPAGDAVQVLAWRIEAKEAQRALLAAATFKGDVRAGVVAGALLAQCDRLLPGV